MTYASGETKPVVTEDDLTSNLREFVYARNNLRSCRKEAEGFTSGKRIVNLTAAKRREKVILAKILGWAEQRARDQLGMPQIEFEC